MLTLALPAPPAAPRLKAQLSDVVTGMSAGTVEEECGECTSKDLQRAAGRLAAQLLQAAANRGRGTLHVSSQPPGAAVLVAGHRLGKTPLSREASDGPHEVLLEKEGYDGYALRGRRGMPCT